MGSPQSQLALQQQIVNGEIELSNVPINEITYELCAAFATYGDLSKSVNFIPEKFCTKSLINIMLKRDPYVLDKFDNEKRTPRICSHILKQITIDNNKNYKMFTHSISINQLVTSIPPQHINVLMIKSNRLYMYKPYMDTIYAHALKTLELDEFMVKAYNYNAKNIPKNNLSCRVCAIIALHHYAVVTHDRMADNYHRRRTIPMIWKEMIPPAHQIPETWSEFLKLKKWNTPDVLPPHHMLSQENCVEYIQQMRDRDRTFYFGNIPPEFHSTELYKNIIPYFLGNRDDFSRIQPKYMIPELVAFVWKRNINTISIIPHHLQTIDMRDHIIKVKCALGKYINPDFLPTDYLSKQIQINPLFLNDFPQVHPQVHKELALEFSLRVILPTDNRSFDLCVECCRKNMDELQFVPIHLQTPVCVKLGHPIYARPDPPPYLDG